MAHHGSDIPDELFRKMFGDGNEEPPTSIGERIRSLEAEIGPTGKFPQGKIAEEDEGEIAMAVGHAKGKIFINFGKPTAWIGFDPVQARQLAMTLMDHANKAPMIGATAEDSSLKGDTSKP